MPVRLWKRIAFSLLLAAMSPRADDFSLGAQAGAYGTAYHTRHADYWGLPYIGLNAGRFYIDGTEAGWWLAKDDAFSFAATAWYADTHFDAADGATPALRAVDSRRSTMMAGFSAQYITPWGALAGKIGHDALNNSNGIAANLSWILMKEFGQFTLVPAVGADWWNARQTRYYYGVSRHEADRSQLPTYRPGSTIVPFMLVGFNYDWKNSWNTWGQVTQRFYPHTVTASPLVNRQSVTELTLGVSYSF